MSDEPHDSPPARGWHRSPIRWAAQALVLFGLWAGFSGHLNSLFLTAGAISAVLVVVVTERVFHPNAPAGFALPPNSLWWLVKASSRFVAYTPLMAWEIVLANLQVARLILDPRLPIDPCLVEFGSSLPTESANALLAQSITLTPGTITVDMSRHRFVVHCISLGSRQSLADGTLMRRIAKVYGEPDPAPPVLRDVSGPAEVSW